MDTIHMEDYFHIHVTLVAEPVQADTSHNEQSGA